VKKPYLPDPFLGRIAVVEPKKYLMNAFVNRR
jgi:hypothetical protein